MDPAAIASLLEIGPWGFSALCIAGLIWQNKKIDSIRVQQINDTKLALEAVSKSTDNLNNAEDRMTEQTALLKEWVIVARAQQNRGA